MRSKSYIVSRPLIYDTQEAQTREIDLSCEEPEIPEIAIRFCYRFRYAECVPAGSEVSDDNDSQVDLILFAIADKYDLPMLSECALQHFKNVSAH